MLKLAITGIALLCCIAGRSDAVSAQALLMVAPPKKISPEQLVAARRSAFYLSAMTMARMKDAIANDKSKIEDMKWPAQFLAQWAGVLPTMFPAGSDTPESQARSTVWSDRAGFETKAKEYAAAASDLAKIATSGDRTAFAAGRERLVQTCNACHSGYRKD